MASCDRITEHQFLGSVTVGERGQVVIPAEARRLLGINTGDKLLVIGHALSHGLILCQVDVFRDVLGKFTEGLNWIANDDSSEDASKA